MQRMIGEVKDFARKDPVKAVAACFGAGLLVHLLPTRVLVGTISGAGAALLPPALLFLGIIKSIELCSHNSNHQPNTIHD